MSQKNQKRNNLQKGVVCCKKWLNFREKPSEDAAILAAGPIKNGTEIDIFYKRGDWYKIKFNGAVGFVMSKFVEIKEN